MKTQPNFKITDLEQTLNTQYDLDVKEIVYSPAGEDAFGYHITADKRYYLKVYNRALDWDSVLGIPRWLNQNGLHNVVCAIETKSGELKTSLDDYVMALYPFIDGAMAYDKPFDDDQLTELGRILGRLHHMTDKLTIKPKVETFDRPRWQRDYRRIIDEIPNALKSDDPYKRELGQTMGFLKDRLLQELTVFEAYIQRARSHNAPQVLCHADPNIANVLAGKDGNIYVIDWDGVMLAPKERDLMHFGKDDQPKVEPVLNGYQSVVGDVTVNEIILSYYHLEWNIQEVCDYGVRLMFEDHPEEQKAHDLAEMKEVIEEFP